MDENMSQENVRCTTGEESIVQSKARCTMDGESIAQSKALLRREKIKARDAIPPSERDKRSEAVVDRILESESFRKAEIVMIYRAVRGEVRLDLLPVRAPEKKYVYPLCLENHEMRAMLPVSPDGWRPGPFHIPEPDPDLSEEIPPEKIDLVLCPCTAFDAECNRLGMGGGYYDRFLPKCRNAEVYGAAYEVQRAERVPHNQLDRPMDGVFTEKERIVIGSIAGNSR
ncbi:MAG: 5-formyltetrahydrofolate cyclo-ligase [Lachnospiraceae bacterium]|nr:5-formyltetrahydrofolate cyclo-ligase [Lachnospiraceae bacterium]